MEETKKCTSKIKKLSIIFFKKKLYENKKNENGSGQGAALVASAAAPAAGPAAPHRRWTRRSAPRPAAAGPAAPRRAPPQPDRLAPLDPPPAPPRLAPPLAPPAPPSPPRLPPLACWSRRASRHRPHGAGNGEGEQRPESTGSRCRWRRKSENCEVEWRGGGGIKGSCGSHTRG